MLIRDAEVWRLGPADVRIAGGRIAAVGALAPLAGEAVIEANGGLLLPGLWDHHIHLAATAARRASVVCGPPEVRDEAGLRAALAGAPGDGWIRGVLYHESVMGMPDAGALDLVCPDRPLRMQHRGGRMWLFNSAGLDAVLEGRAPPKGMEKVDGRLTGRLFDADAWLRGALGGGPPGLGAVGRELAAHGVTGVTEMSVGNGPAEAGWLAGERESGRLPQRVLLAGGLALGAGDGWALGPAKLHLHEAALPDPDDATAFVRAAHAAGRGVAVHCTTEVELVFALAVLAAAGTPAAAPRRPADRIEHAGIAPDHLVDEIAAMGLSVVSQPHFIAERGDQYARDVAADEVPLLYRLAAFARAGVALAAGSDAPFGLADPWAAMRAAVSRKTSGGLTIGAQEALDPEAALRLFLTDPVELARERRVAVGADADLCLLDRGWAAARERLSAGDVRMTFLGGNIIHQRVDQPPLQRGPR